MTSIIAIVGAGYSGTSLAINLCRLATKPITILLFEAKPQFAHGAAYSTTNASHLLNVVANDMSAFPDQPNDFVEWLKQQPEIQASNPEHFYFAPRMLYGRYLQKRLSQASKTGSIKLHNVEVIALSQTKNKFKLTTANNQTFLVDKVVLAHGNPAPKNLFPYLSSQHYVNDPWSYDFVKNISPTDDVLIIGTGLTMIDVVLALADQKHRGKIYALSRRGLLPQTHHEFKGRKLTEYIPENFRELIRYVRCEIKLFAAYGGDWRAAITHLRPLTQQLWQSFSLPEKRRFLRHLMPYWDTHRHRIAPPIAARLHALRAAKQLQILAAKILTATEDLFGVEVKIRLRNSTKQQSLAVAHVINCTGPNTDYHHAQHPLLKNLIQQGLIQPDELRIGLAVADNGAMINANGVVSNKLFTLGTPCKGKLWECVAVPDIRQQSAYLAKVLLE
jgi:uncharacterized NAD(P)/FAD-binding protein YdhS